MGAGATTGIDARAVGGDYERLMALLRWGATRMPLTAVRGMRRAGGIMESALRENLSGGVLQRRTSTLARSVGIREEDGGMRQVIGARAFYIATHEGVVENAEIDGNYVVIRPKHGPYLRFQMHVGNALRMTRRGGLAAGARINQFVQVRKVRIPIRRPLGVTYDENAERAVAEAWATIARALDGGGD